ncbi:MAG TPA: LD-carboxypeptidase [Vicinamibacterales bacterium]|nr:LD-carboxypeptidase [Vicinamibacterales bacterium]
MIRPRALRPGDRLAIVAPASPFGREEFDRGLDELRQLGFVPVFDDRVFARRSYVAGDPAVRAAAFGDAWRDPSIAGIVAARGGYGSVQVLPWLDRDAMRRTPKVFVGYSDVTSLLSFLTTGCGLVAFHGPTVAGRFERGAEGYDRDTFLRAVMRAEPLGELAPASLETVRRGQAAGPLLGGTLTQLAASLGTPYAFLPPPGCVLFLEDVGERPYRLDRLLTQLRLAGILAPAAGLVFGEMRGCDEPGGGPSARAVIGDVLADFPGPVLFGFPSGHTTGPAWTLPFGVTARVIGGDRPRLVIDEAAVEAGT